MYNKSGKRKARIAVGLTAMAVFASIAFYLPQDLLSASAQVRPRPRPTPRRTAARTPRPTPTPRRSKYSEFAHSTKAHQMDCASCHKFPSKNWNIVRTGDSAYPDITEYPEHSSCIRCHTQQFFRGARPVICSVCHTAASPRNSTRHPFPNPREIYDKSPKGKTAESDFVVGFPHDKHIEIVSASRSASPSFVNASFIRAPRRQTGEESCAVCHQTMAPQGNSDEEYLTKPPATLGDGFWLKKGTFKTKPTSHTTCFTCHSADSGMSPAPSDCATCHKLKPLQPMPDLDIRNASAMIGDNKMMMDLWVRRNSTGVFRHEFFAHVELACSTCHNVATLDTTDPMSTKVSISSCAMCHATPTTDDGGAINYEIDQRKSNATFQCTKCHIVYGRMPIPESHLKAVADSGK